MSVVGCVTYCMSAIYRAVLHTGPGVDDDDGDDDGGLLTDAPLHLTHHFSDHTHAHTHIWVNKVWQFLNVKTLFVFNRLQHIFNVYLEAEIFKARKCFHIDFGAKVHEIAF